MEEIGLALVVLFVACVLLVIRSPGPRQMRNRPKPDGWTKPTPPPAPPPKRGQS